MVLARYRGSSALRFGSVSPLKNGNTARESTSCAVAEFPVLCEDEKA
jgi:hypothetical protein